jgi:hypothetical protein
MSNIETYEGGMDKFTRGYELMGFNISADSIVYREWAPAVVEAYLIGDFSELLMLYPCLLGVVLLLRISHNQTQDRL